LKPIDLVLAFVIGMMVFQAGIIFFAGDESYADQCRENTILWAGLRACYDDPNCNLGDDEMFSMYKLNKNALMSCQMRNVKQSIIRKDALDALAEQLTEELLKEEPAAAEPESKFSRPTEESFSASS